MQPHCTKVISILQKGAFLKILAGELEGISDKLLAYCYYRVRQENIVVLLRIIQKLQQKNRYKKIAKALFKAFKPILYAVGTSKLNGRQKFRSDQKTILIVSHEASYTGAPILAYNIAKEMGKTCNVIVILMRGGDMKKSFLEVCVALLEPTLGILTSGSLEKNIGNICNNQRPEVAYVNSIVSAGAIQPIRRLGIPVITLIHEFGLYIRPLDVLEKTLIWSNHLVFSSKLTHDDIKRRCPEIDSKSISILPQGKCTRPTSTKNKTKDSSKGMNQAEVFLKKVKNDQVLILGAGEVQPRKGIDLFIATCREMEKLNMENNYIYAWIGSGYDPHNDFNVSIWLEDQIEKSGLKTKLTMLKSSKFYGELMKRADIFLMTSRLDPLPNVAIDAMLNGIPMLCFEKACGLESYLREDQLLMDNLLCDYLNTRSMAKKAVSVINDKTKYKSISSKSKIRAEEWFAMGSYIQKLEEIGEKKQKKILKYVLR